MMVETTKPIDPVEGDNRLTAFPISRPGLWEYYKDARRSFWSPEEIDFSKDRDDYNNHPKMTDSIRRFVDYILALFASLDKLVNVNIASRFKAEIGIFEADCFYDYQMMIENIHNETYSLQLDTIITDPERKKALLESVKTIPAIAKMAKWVNDCVDSSTSIGERLLRMVCVEGIFFTGAFCAIYWLQDLGFMKGLCQANELISRDEGQHTFFALFLFSLLRSEHKPSVNRIHEIFKEANEIGREFATEAIPKDMLGMNASLMSAYLECQTDNLLALIDIPLIYNSKNPFYYMEKINMINRGNFFERRITEYSRPKSGDSTDQEQVGYF